MASDTAGAIKQSGEQEELNQIEAPPGVIEAMELYKAAMPHYAAAAARLVPRVSRVASTSAALAANFPG